MPVPRAKVSAGVIVGSGWRNTPIRRAPWSSANSPANSKIPPALVCPSMKTTISRTAASRWSGLKAAASGGGDDIDRLLTMASSFSYYYSHPTLRLPLDVVYDVRDVDTRRGDPLEEARSYRPCRAGRATRQEKHRSVLFALPEDIASRSVTTDHSPCQRRACLLVFATYSCSGTLPDKFWVGKFSCAGSAKFAPIP